MEDQKLALTNNKIILRIYDKKPLCQEEDGVSFCLDNLFRLNDTFCIKSYEYEKHYSGLKEYIFSKRNLKKWCYDKKNYPDSIYIKYTSCRSSESKYLTVKKYMNLNYSFEAIFFMLKMIFKEQETNNKLEVFTVMDNKNVW